jgi:uncharacterized protein
MNNLVKARIKAIYLHPTQKVPVVFVTDEQGKVVVPMIIGFLEAQAILFAWQGAVVPRPVTADLLKSIIEEDFKAHVEKVVVKSIKAGAFLATIHMRQNGTVLERDSRPSDALALAVRTKAPIYLSRTIIDKMQKEQRHARAMLEYLEQESADSDAIIKF